MQTRLVPADIIRNLGSARGWLVAYSGGCDSRVLLEIVAAARSQLPGTIRAIHIDHGLHPDSADWAAHCERICQRLKVPLSVERVVVEPGPSPEARAREARHAAFIDALGPGEVLLTAHHLDDQAETLLLRLLRGTGVTGMAAMALERRFGRGWLRRPLLSVSRAAIHAWARQQALEWIDDPSNAERVADRNYLRHEIVPRLELRWTGVSARLAGAASEAAEARLLLDTLADEDGATDTPRLSIASLTRLQQPARQRNLFRRWIQLAGLMPPGRRRLEAGLKMLVEAADDRQPELTWPGGRIRRYRDLLYLDDAAETSSPPAEPIYWSGNGDLKLDIGRLAAKQCEGGLDPAYFPPEGLRLRFGMQGMRCRPRGRPTRSLKHLFQEAGIPPWLRTRWPILCAGDRIVSVPSVCICEGYIASHGKRGVFPEWHWR